MFSILVDSNSHSISCLLYEYNLGSDSLALNTCNYIIGEAKMQSIVACCQKKPSIFDWSYETWSCYFYLLHIILKKKVVFFFRESLEDWNTSFKNR